MRAIIRTDAPEELPDELLSSTVERHRRDSDNETFALLEGLEAIGDMSGGVGVYIWPEANDEDVAAIHDEDGDQLPIEHGKDGEYGDVTVVASAADGVEFEAERHFEPAGSEVSN